MLNYKNVEELFENTRGVKDNTIIFKQVYLDPAEDVSKGLFVILKSDENSEKNLKEALYNGAIGVLWPNDKELPHFLPNHFPVFLVENTVTSLRQLIEHYIKITEENRYNNMTKFMPSYQDTHNDHFFTYDKSVIEELAGLTKLLNSVTSRKGGDNND